MPKKKLAEAGTETESDGVRKLTVVRRKEPFDWGGALKKAQEEHWRRLVVTIQVREWLMAGKPASLDAAKAMLKARGLEDAIEAVDISDPEKLKAAAEEVQDEGLCEFSRREGKSGIWFPTNNIKAGLKENWSVLGYRVEHRGSRGALAEGVFVFSVQPPDAPTAERDWIALGAGPDGVHTAVTHSIGPRGPISSIKRHEYLVRPRLVFEVAIAHAVAEKLPDEAFADMLVHMGEHGVGACRSQGYGRFDIVAIEEKIDEPKAEVK